MHKKTIISTMQSSVVENKTHFPFLDALRGISALTVVVYHAMLFTAFNYEISPHRFVRGITLIINYGHLAVPVFIVLSGFCLTIPVVTSPAQKLKDGFGGYIFRRFKRIVPAYYAAIVFSLLLITLLPVLQHQTNTTWDTKIPVTSGAVASHIFLLHNIKDAWIYKINGAMWSLATEWQIYFIFPLLLYVKRKINTISSVLLAVLAGFLLMKVNIRQAHPHFIGLFAMGMLAAVMAFSADNRVKQLLQSIKGKATIFSLFVLNAVVFIAMRKTNIHEYVYENIFGFSIAFILALTANNILTSMRGGGQYLANPIFTNSLTRWLGKFSYSLYLIHGPMLAACNLYFIKAGFGYDIRLLLMWVFAVPLSVALAYLFYLLFEKPFTAKTKG